MTEAIASTYRSAGIQSPLSNNTNKSTGIKELLNGETEAKPAIQASYFSPVLRVDPQTSVPILVYRDSDTGETRQQFPNEKEVKAYQKSALLNEEKKAVEPAPDTKEPERKQLDV